MFTADLSPVGPGFDPTSVHVRFVVDKKKKKKATGQVCLPDFCFPPSASFRQCPISSSSTCCSYRKDKRAKLGDIPKNKILSKITEHWIKKSVHLFIPSMVMNTVVLKFMAQCAFVNGYQRFGGTPYFHVQETLQLIRHTERYSLQAVIRLTPAPMLTLLGLEFIDIFKNSVPTAQKTHRMRTIKNQGMPFTEIVAVCTRRLFTYVGAC